MNAHYQNPATQYPSLADLDIVCPELSERISAAVSTGTHFIRETYIHRYSHSRAEFTAACEMAENLGLAIH